jgi:diadenosine tetraphosphatase ApaH/serine/threonine PP2A family protein phosphatase
VKELRIKSQSRKSDPERGSFIFSFEREIQKFRANWLPSQTFRFADSGIEWNRWSWMSGDLDAWIETLKTGEILPEADVTQIIELIEPILTEQTNVLYLGSPIIICGDIHGQLDDLLYLLSDEVSGRGNYYGKYLFMGDYVDRGHHSINTLLLLLCLKLKDPERFHLLRGNHESRSVTQQYGFLNECLVNYGHSWIYTRFNELFDLFPVAAVVDRQIFCVHGGLSPELLLVQNISEFDRVTEIPESGPLADLTWSDPENVTDWRRNQRGAGFLFGPKQVEKWCHVNNLRFMTRSHQLAAEGYRWWFPPPEPRKKSLIEGKLLLVWSAPNYAYQSGNLAAILKWGFGDREYLTIKQFGPSSQRIPRKHETAGQYFM